MNCGCSGGRWDAQVVREALIRTFSAMDGEILADAARSGARCGSTACVALQLGGDLYVAHAGARAAGPSSRVRIGYPLGLLTAVRIAAV